VPCSLYDLRNAVVLQSRGRRSLLVRLRLRLRLTPVCGGLWRRAARLMTIRRRIEQDEVLMMRWEKWLCLGLRGRCRQAGGTGGKP